MSVLLPLFTSPPPTHDRPLGPRRSDNDPLSHAVPGPPPGVRRTSPWSTGVLAGRESEWNSPWTSTVGLHSGCGPGRWGSVEGLGFVPLSRMSCVHVCRSMY